ncbi:hypothetical protein B1R30_04770 [Staphylococcus epidermidis]|uniref:Uncharacterized protein n=1 Tax=Staphylococcus epidermidis TaxID=1282 RepID=A0AAE5V7D3_STAEP|nr:hypothetical protein B1R30_04770 [Staphylococcus epidermidis]PIH07964.1 hypothetical protein CTJ00_03795 [Staphylococcus epidermidis]PIH10382.1 hypothetical protein CTJ08_06670 [Staphylococcus epidermidis]PIH20207.1 hypothetical protein CTJ05_03865 [Staphylococcus epidermidis]PIH22887.1 hypothetical protein CTJ04_01400 [Staphylococcus epidermidis]
MSQVFLIYRQTIRKYTCHISNTFNTPHKDEVHVEILRTRQVGVRGPNKENFTEKFHGQGKLSVTWITYSK